jgi:hypothetical protein
VAQGISNTIFFNLNYFPMKRNVKMMGLLSLLFVLGGMFLVGEASAQTQQAAQLTVISPNGKSWVPVAQANQVVSQEISLLTTKLNQLIQQGASDKDVRLAKAELLLWLTIQEYLNSGMPVGHALEAAYARFNSPSKAWAGGNQNLDPGKVAILEGWYNNAVGKLTA